MNRNNRQEIRPIIIGFGNRHRRPIPFACPNNFRYSGAAAIGQAQFFKKVPNNFNYGRVNRLKNSQFIGLILKSPGLSFVPKQLLSSGQQ